MAVTCLEWDRLTYSGLGLGSIGPGRLRLLAEAGLGQVGHSRALASPRLSHSDLGSEQEEEQAGPEGL